MHTMLNLEHSHLLKRIIIKQRYDQKVEIFTKQGWYNECPSTLNPIVMAVSLEVFQ